MIQDLSFYPDFRPNQGPSGEIKELLDDDLSGVQSKPGIYIIASTREKFLYPSGNKSKVLYIGKADNLKRRLREHKCHLSEAWDRPNDFWFYNRNNYMKAFGAHVYFYYGRQSQEAKEMEADFMHHFYEKYEAIPLCNGARSFSKR